MTVIAAYKGPDGIYLGGDSMAADDHDVMYIKDSKVFDSGICTIGYAGSFRFGQLLAYSFKAPVHDPALSDVAYMFSVWLEALREVLAKHGLLKIENGVESIGEDGSALVIYKEDIYHIQEDLSILRIATPYAAIGAGMSYAIGAMYALDGCKISSEDMVIKAVEAAIEYCPQCGGDIKIVKHDPNRPVKKPRGRPRKK